MTSATVGAGLHRQVNLNVEHEYSYGTFYSASQLFTDPVVSDLLNE